MNRFLRFIIYGLLGMIIEILFTGFSDIKNMNFNLVGHTSVWMFFVYGSAVFVLEPVYGLIKNENTIIRGCVYATTIFFIEFSSGMILDMLNITAWKYQGELSVMGYIRLDYAMFWFLLGLVFEKFYCFISKIQYINKGGVKV